MHIVNRIKLIVFLVVSLSFSVFSAEKNLVVNGDFTDTENSLLKRKAKEITISKEAFLNKLKEEYKTYAQTYQDPDTGLVYTATVKELKEEKNNTVADVLKGMVRGVLSPHGYGDAGDSCIADTSLFGGLMLYSMLEAYDVNKDPEIEKWAKLLFNGMKIIGTTSPVSGFIVRGPHPNNRQAYYKDSSMDQHSVYVLALWRYYNSPLATNEDKAFIRDSVDKVVKRLEKNKWHILTEDNSQEAWASGGDLKSFDSEAVIKLLSFIGAAADLTNDKHWKDLYEKFANENNCKRWQVLLPDNPGFKMNGHLLWGQQSIFRANCLYSIEKETERRKIICEYLKGFTNKRMNQEFPPQKGQGVLFEMFKNYTPSPDEAKQLGWEKRFFESSVEAWKHYKPEYKNLPATLMVKIKNICILFPSSAFTMAVFSRDSKLEKETIPFVIEMLEAVDLTRLYGWPRWGVIVPGWKAYALYSETNKE